MGGEEMKWNASGFSLLASLGALFRRMAWSMIGDYNPNTRDLSCRPLG